MKSAHRLRSRRLLLLAAAVGCGMLGGPPIAAAQPAPRPPSEVAAELPGARLQGSGELKVLFFHVYDVRLWNSGQAVTDDWAEVPLALQVDYARSVDGSAIAEQSLLEMRRQQGIGDADAAAWLARLRALFPDVKSGDRLTVIRSAASGPGLQTFHNGNARGRIDDPRLARLFVGIWLSPRTSEPALRKALLGTTAGPAAPASR